MLYEKRLKLYEGRYFRLHGERFYLKDFKKCYIKGYDYKIKLSETLYYYIKIDGEFVYLHKELK